MTTPTQSFGEQLRGWRLRRRLSQLDLALDAEVSQRHLSFLESGRSTPSRDMILRLAERISIPPRERNALLVAAGFAPHYQERALDDTTLTAARAAVETILAAHAPYPALAVDRHWTLVVANEPARRLMADVHPALVAAPANVLRISLHPEGLAPRIANYREWRGHILNRVAAQADASGDPVLAVLAEELKSYPTPPNAKHPDARSNISLAGIAIPFQLMTGEGLLSFLSMTTVFGTPIDISLSELAIESFFPADPATAEAMRRLAG